MSKNMLKISFWKWIFPVHQYYFSYQEKKESLWFYLFGVEELVQLPEKIDGFTYTEYDTWITYLEQPLDDIFQLFSSTKRNEIHRSAKEWIQNEQLILTDHVLDEYVTFYNRFASYKKLPLSSRNFLQRFQWNLLLTRSCLERETLVYHLYIIDGDYIRLFQSCSFFRDESSLMPKNMVSWANNGLHYFDIWLGKKSGYRQYDWGGIYNWPADTQDAIDKLSISRFKLWFSPVLIKQWNHIRYGYVLSFILYIWRKFF